MSNENEKIGFKGVAIIAGMIALFIFCWNVAYDLTGRPNSAGEFVLCFIVTLIILAVVVTILTHIGKAFRGEKAEIPDSSDTPDKKS
jgi:phosphatidylserine synthase